MPSEGKIKAKDLSYEATLPPFLQRLHAQNAGRGDLDRHEQPIARPERVKTSDEDDGPTLVDESGEIVSKEEYEELTVNGIEEDGGSVTGELKGDGEPKASGAIQDCEGRKAEQKVTDGTATKKRKVVKVVGDQGEEAGQKDKPKDETAPEKALKKAKKKAKPIKLAFDDGDERI